MKECNSIYILQYEVYPLGHLPTLWSKMCSPRSHHTFQVYINRSNQSINTININIMSDLNTLYKICCQFEQPLHFRALRVAVALQSGHHASYNWACHFHHHLIYAIILELTSSLFTIMTSSHEHPFPIETSWVCECEMAVGWIASWSYLILVDQSWF